MTSVALVFRTVGERTSDHALELAKRALSPEEVYVISGVRPFSVAVRHMVELDFGTEQVVAVDADSLILEDMRPWLERNHEPYVDCYVFDRFRGRLHCGVHITRIDVMRAMRDVTPPEDEQAYVLRPESRVRRLALDALGCQKSCASFRILHDHFQYLRDVWTKYALRELRSRTAEQRKRLDRAMARWAAEGSIETRVASEAVRWAKAEVPDSTPPDELARVIERLHTIAPGEIAKLGLSELGPLSREEVEEAASGFDRAHPWFAKRQRVFGLGLSRTGTLSLTSALNVLGVDCVHYPIDDDSWRALSSGKADFRLLEYFDGITDITTVPYFEQLERRYPDAKFVLTLRDEASWLASCEAHFADRDPFEAEKTPGARTHMHIRRFLRAAVYGSYVFDAERFRFAYARHVEAVRRYFADKPGKLLELNVAGGEGYEKLAPFLGRPIPDQPFPHRRGSSRHRMGLPHDPDD